MVYQDAFSPKWILGIYFKSRLDSVLRKTRPNEKTKANVERRRKRKRERESERQRERLANKERIETYV